jgi:transcriptional regulator with XRE-family HTH domain
MATEAQTRKNGPTILGRAARRVLLRSLGAEVKKHRKAKGLSQNELSAVAGLSQNVVSNIERGLTQPTYFVLCALAIRLDVDLADLLRNIELRNLRGVIAIES